jgi:hypothetical protein
MEATPNELLRGARLRLPSPATLDRPMSRAELVEAVNRHIWETTGVHSALSESAYAKYERGVVRCPNEKYREALRHVLGCQSDAELGFRPTPRGRSMPSAAQVASPRQDFTDGEADPVDRRNFLRVVAVGASVATTEMLAADVAKYVTPATVSEADIEHLHTMARFVNNWSRQHGGGAIRSIVSSEMSRAVGLLKTNYPDRLRPALFAAVGTLGVAGASALFDAHEHDLASRLFTFSANAAEEADDWHLRAKALDWRARQAIWLGEPDAGLTYAELGLVRVDRLTATEQAMVNNSRARAYARMGAAEATLRAVGAADEAFTRADPANDPPWMKYFDKYQHLGDTGHALFDIAVNGTKVGEATRRLTESVNGHTDDFIRSRAFSGLKLASLTMRTGDPRQAVEIAHRARQDKQGIKSKRLDLNSSELVRDSAPHRDLSDVREFLEAVRA